MINEELGFFFFLNLSMINNRNSFTLVELIILLLRDFVNGALSSIVYPLDERWYLVWSFIDNFFSM